MPASVRDLEQIRAVTSNFFFWQGLRWVPMGVFLLVIGWQSAGPDRFDGLFGALVFALSMVGTIAGSSAAGRYYRRKYGTVRGLAGAHSKRESIKWGIAYPAMLISLVLDAKFQLPVLASGFVWGAGILAYWWSTGKGRAHYLIAASAFVALGLRPLVSDAPAGMAMFDVFFVLLGLTYVIGGVLDHLELARIMRASGIPEETT